MIISLGFALWIKNASNTIYCLCQILCNLSCFYILFTLLQSSSSSPMFLDILYLLDLPSFSVFIDSSSFEFFLFYSMILESSPSRGISLMILESSSSGGIHRLCSHALVCHLHHHLSCCFLLLYVISSRWHLFLIV